MTLKEYGERIKKATTREELRDIAYSAFLQDKDGIFGKLYDRVIDLCIRREAELGLL